LKSFGFATNIYTPDHNFGFVSYCRDRGLESVEPCVIADFANYGIWVQETLLPMLERVNVTELSRVKDVFELELSDGSKVHAKQVVVAVGITYFAHMPEILGHFPKSWQAIHPTTGTTIPSMGKTYASWGEVSRHSKQRDCSMRL